MQTNHSPDSLQTTGPAAKSSLTINEPRWYSVLALVLAASAFVYAVMTQRNSDIREAAWNRAFAEQQEQQRRTETEARVAINHYMVHSAKEQAYAKR